MMCRGRAFWDCTGFIIECLGEESKEEKRRDLGDLGRKIEM